MIANQRITRAKDMNYYYSGKDSNKPQQYQGVEAKQRIHSNSSKTPSKTPSRTPSRTPAKKQQNQGISKSPKKSASLKTPRTCTEKKQTTYGMRNHSNTGKYGYACETTQRKSKLPVSQQVFSTQQDTKKKMRKVLLVKNPLIEKVNNSKNKISPENDSILQFSEEDFKKVSQFADSLESLKDNQHSKLVRSLVQYTQQLIKYNQTLKEKNQTLNRKHHRLLTLLSSNGSQSASPQASQKKRNTADISIHHSQTKQKQHNQVISQHSGNKSALSHRSFNSSANPLDDGLESQRKLRVTSTPQQQGTPFRLNQEPIWPSSPFQFESPSVISPIAKRILSMTNSPESNHPMNTNNNNTDTIHNNNFNYKIKEENQEQSELQQSVIAFIQSSTNQQQCNSPQFNQHFHNVISNRNNPYTNSSLSSSFRSNKAPIAFTNVENYHLESNKENIPLFASSANNTKQHQGIVEQTSSLLRSPSFVNLSTEQIYMMTKQKSKQQCHHSFQCIPSQVEAIIPEQVQQETQRKEFVFPSTVTATSTTSGTTATTTASNSKKTILVVHNKNISNPQPSVQIKKPTKTVAKLACHLSKSARAAAHINVGEYLGEISCSKNKQRAISLQPQTKLQQQQQHTLSSSAYNPEQQQAHKQRLQKRIDSLYHYREASLSLKYPTQISNKISLEQS